MNKNEAIEHAAARELKEEAGVISSKIDKIGLVRPSIGIIDEETVIYLAQNLRKVHNFKVQEREIEKVMLISFKNVIQMIKKEEIKDGLTITAMLLAKDFLKIS